MNNNTRHHVGFLINNNEGENSSMGEGDTRRQMNSKREFQIRKTSNSNSKRRQANGRNKGNKSPSDFTNVGGKSVVSMFTSHSGKTTFSAPVHGNEESVSEAG